MTRSRSFADDTVQPPDERPLLRLERQILFRVTSIDWDGAEDLRASVPHLVWTGGCDCGCGSYRVRDLRHREQSRVGEQWCDAFSPDGVAQLRVWLGTEGRLMEVDVVTPAGGPLPASADLRVRWPAPAQGLGSTTRLTPCGRTTEPPG